MRLLTFWMLLMMFAFSAFAETDVQFFFANPQYGLTQTTNRYVVLQGINYSSSGIYTLIPFQISGYTDTNGQITFSNLSGSTISGYYHVVVPYTTIGGQTWSGYIQVTSTNLGLINGNTIFYTTGVNTIPQNGAAWTAQTSDLRYAPIGSNGGSATNAIPLLNGAGTNTTLVNSPSIGVTNINILGIGTAQSVSSQTFAVSGGSTMNGITNLGSLSVASFMTVTGEQTNSGDIYIGGVYNGIGGVFSGVTYSSGYVATGSGFNGSGAGLTSLPGANVTGKVPSAIDSTIATNLVSGSTATNLTTTSGSTINGNGSGLTNVYVGNLATNNSVAAPTANQYVQWSGTAFQFATPAGSAFYVGSGNTNNIQVLTNSGTSVTLYAGPNMVETNPSTPQTVYNNFTIQSNLVVQGNATVGGVYYGIGGVFSGVTYSSGYVATGSGFSGNGSGLTGVDLAGTAGTLVNGYSNNVAGVGGGANGGGLTNLQASSLVGGIANMTITNANFLNVSGNGSGLTNIPISSLSTNNAVSAPTAGQYVEWNNGFQFGTPAGGSVTAGTNMVAVGGVVSVGSSLTNMQNISSLGIETNSGGTSFGNGATNYNSGAAIKSAGGFVGSGAGLTGVDLAGTAGTLVNGYSNNVAGVAGSQVNVGGGTNLNAIRQITISGSGSVAFSSATDNLGGSNATITITGGGGAFYVGSGNTNNIQVLTNSGTSVTLYAGPNVVETNPPTPQTVYNNFTIQSNLVVQGNATVAGTNATGTAIITNAVFLNPVTFNGITNTGYETITNNGPTAVYITGNTNGYFELNIQNFSNGTNASSDWTTTANNGSATSFYFNGGINSSTFGTGSPPNGTNNAYLLAVGPANNAANATDTVNLAIEVAQTNSSLYASVGNGGMQTNWILNSAGETLNSGIFSGNGGGLTNVYVGNLATNNSVAAPTAGQYVEWNNGFQFGTPAGGSTPIAGTNIVVVGSTVSVGSSLTNMQNISSIGIITNSGGISMGNGATNYSSSAAIQSAGGFVGGGSGLTGLSASSVIGQLTGAITNSQLIGGNYYNLTIGTNCMVPEGYTALNISASTFYLCPGPITPGIARIAWSKIFSTSMSLANTNMMFSLYTNTANASTYLYSGISVTNYGPANSTSININSNILNITIPPGTWGFWLAYCTNAQGSFTGCSGALSIYGTPQ